MNSEECRQGFGSEVLVGSRNVRGIGSAGLADDGRWFGARVWQAGGVEADSADCDWRNGFENGFSPARGEDSQGRGKRRLTAFSLNGVDWADVAYADRMELKAEGFSLAG